MAVGEGWLGCRNRHGGCYINGFLFEALHVHILLSILVEDLELSVGPLCERLRGLN